MKSPSYHHGNLRAVLLDLAEQRLAAQGHENLSLRDLALAAKVAASAPYRHFSSREALLCELAQRGFERLGAAYAAAGVAPDPQSRLRAACRAYFDFAAREPQMFRLMFMTDLVMRANKTQNLRIGIDSFETLEGLLRATMPGATPLAVRSRMLVLWSLLHGAAVLLQEGQVDHLLLPGLGLADVLEDILARASGS